MWTKDPRRDARPGRRWICRSSCQPNIRILVEIINYRITGCVDCFHAVGGVVETLSFSPHSPLRRITKNNTFFAKRSTNICSRCFACIFCQQPGQKNLPTPESVLRSSCIAAAACRTPPRFSRACSAPTAPAPAETLPRPQHPDWRRGKRSSSALDGLLRQGSQTAM